MIRKVKYICFMALISSIFFSCHCLPKVEASEKKMLPILAAWESIPIRTIREKLEGISGGEGFQQIQALTYAPSNPAIVYLSTDTSQIWKSTDGGFSWQPKNKGFAANGARSIIVDPRNYNIIFAAGFLGYGFDRAKKYKHRLQGIYRSKDGGENWILLRKTDFFKQESKGCLFAFDSSCFKDNLTSIIYAGSFNEGLLKTVDDGETWRIVGFRNQRIIDIKENPAESGVFLVATEDGLYRYTNESIKKIGRGLNVWPRSIAISRNPPNIVYAALGKNGVYKSTDGGETFKASSKGLPVCNDYTDIAVSPVNANIVYLLADKSNLNPFYSHDGAISWHSASNEKPREWTERQGFWVSGPFSPHPKDPMKALVAANGKDRIFRTSNGGQNWIYSSSGLTGGRMRDIAFAKNGDMVFCLTDFGLWLTKNNGDTFKKIKIKRMFGSESSYSADIRGNTIVASLGKYGDKGLMVSQNYGRSWKYFSNLIDKFNFISFHSRKDNIIYAGPYKSLDKGVSWRRLSHPVRSMYPGCGDVVYTIDELGKKKCIVLKSLDGGLSWSKDYPDCLFPSTSVIDIAVAPNDPDRIYLATTDGIWIHNKKKWVHMNRLDGLSEDSFRLCYIQCIAIDPNKPNAIYVGKRAPGYGQSNGVFFSDNYGQSWKNISYNLGPNLTVWAIKINPLNDDVYIGTSLGTYRLSTDKRIFRSQL